VNLPSIITFIVIALLGWTRPAYPKVPLALNNSHDSFAVGKYLDILEDPEKSWDIYDVTSPPLSAQFAPTNRETPNFGITPSAFWVRFTVRNDSPTISQWFLVYELPVMERIDLFIPTGKGQYLHKQEGLVLPFSEKEIKHRKFVSPLDIDPQSPLTVYMRFESGSTMLLALSLWNPQAFEAHAGNTNLLLGICVGIILVLVTYNLFLFLSIREKSTLYYVLFLLTFGLNQTGIIGLARQYLWSDSPWLAIHAFAFFGALSQFFGLMFARAYLKTKEHTPRTDMVILAIQVLSLLAAFSIFSDTGIGNLFINLTGVLTFAVLIAASLMCWVKGYRPARFLLLAWSPFFFCGLLFVLAMSGLLEFNDVTQYGFFISFCVGGILLSYAMGDRLHILKDQYLEESVLRQRVEREMHKSEKKLRIILEESPDVVLVVDQRSGHILSVNDAVLGILGYESNDLIGRPFSLLFPEDHSYPHNGRVDDSVDNPTPSKSRKVLRADGSICPIDLTAALIPWNGGNAILATLHDVTERRRAETALFESEQQYRLHFENVTDIIFSVDSSSRFTSISPSVESLLGFKPEEILGVPYSELNLVAPEYVEKTVSDTLLALSGKKVSLSEYELIARDGTRKFVEVSISPFFNEDKLASAICVAREISERKRIEQELNKHQHHLEELVEERTSALKTTNRELKQEIEKRLRMETELLKTQKLESLGILAGGIAHDFNNTLTGIMSNIAMAKMYGELDVESLTALSDAEKASLRAKGLTQQLLTFAKGGAPVKETVPLTDFIRDSVKFALSGSNVRFELFAAVDLWLAEIDEGQVSQVLHNIIINADQAMASGGSLSIRAQNIKVTEGDLLPLKEGKYVRVSITDQGHGIPKEHLPKIFDPFFTTKQNGSGLGLSTSFSIVQKHDGYIHVESEEGVGTTFQLYLPGIDKKADLENKQDNVKPKNGRGRVLLIDDEEYIRRATGYLLTRLGYDTILASDGAEGIDLYEWARDSGRPVDLVIMDLTIPGGMGGKEAIQKLRKIDPRAKAIVVSGYSDDPVMSDHEKYGFQAVMTKPYKIQDLGEIVHKVINRTSV